MNEIPKKNKKNSLFKDAIALYNDLPETLKPGEILKYNKVKARNSKEAEYAYKSLRFLIPQGVFLPRGASKVIFDYLYSDSIRMKGINYLVMGCGAGVEAVIAALKNTKTIYVVDIDPVSVETTKYNYNKIINGKTMSKFYSVVSNLFSATNNDLKRKFNLITFNPPAVSIKISNQKDIIRNTCVGADILNKFFSQIKEKQILSSGGKILVTLSNTSDLKKIIYHAITLGFIPKIVWSNNFKNLKMYLFEFSLNKTEDA